VSSRSESYLRRGREPEPPEEFGVGLGDDREWFSAMLEQASDAIPTVLARISTSLGGNEGDCSSGDARA
jgi:hypothetical protein